jgi:hypothetical protein
VWEASASIGSGGQPYPMRQIGPRLGAVLVAKVHELLADAGDHDAGYWHRDSVSLHFRCPLTAGEISMLDPGWLAAPAVHTGGREDEMTKEPPW